LIFNKAFTSYKFWCISALFLLTTLLPAQTIIVTNANYETLVGVTIQSKEKSVFTTTNNLGEADISEMKGAKDILFQYLGFEDLITSYSELKEKNFTIELQKSSLILEEAVISATRWNNLNTTTPSKVITISPEEIEFNNPQTAADMLGNTGKVFIQKSQQGGGSPMIRGFATSRLIYSVDGVRMNNAIFRGGNIQNVISIDANTLDRSEVLFGPSSVLYGSDALGGVMAFTTKKHHFNTINKLRLNGDVTIRTSSANKERHFHADGEIFNDKFSLITGISLWAFDHLKQGRYGPNDYIKNYHVEQINNQDQVIFQDDPLLQIPSAYNQGNLMTKVKYKFNEFWSADLGVHTSFNRLYGRYDRHNRLKNGFPRYGTWDYGPQYWVMNVLGINTTKSTKYYDKGSIKFARQLFEETRTSREFQSNQSYINKEKVNAYSVNLDFTKQISKHLLVYGAEYVLNDVNSTGTIKSKFVAADTEDAAARYPNSIWSSTGLFIQDDYKLSPLLTLQGGLRLNQNYLSADFSYNNTFYDFPFKEASNNQTSLTGSFGVVYQPSESLIIKTNIGRAFRSPNVDDIGKIFDSEPGSVILPNPNLNPEYATNFDLGGTKIINDQFKFDITGYYTILTNALIRRNAQFNGQDSIEYQGVLSQVQTLQNASEAQIYGIQAGIEYVILPRLKFYANANYQDGYQIENDGEKTPTRHAAPFFGNASLRYTINKLRIETSLFYQGERSHDQLSPDEQSKTEIYALDENGNTYAPSWYILNFKSSYNVNKNISLTAGVENITDQRYRPYSSGISGAGVNFYFAFNWKFRNQTLNQIFNQD